MAALISCTPHMSTCAYIIFLNLIWLHSCCHSVHTTHVHMCLSHLRGYHLASRLLSFRAHHTCPHVLVSSSWVSFGCMAADILCTPHMSTCACLIFLNIIWLHGSFHSVHTIHVHMCLSHLLEHHLAAWLLSFCAHHTRPHVLA